MTCLLCRYYQPVEPPQHQAEREAGRCESSCGDTWNWHTAVNYVREHGKLDGWCRLHPEPKHFGHDHVCGDISVMEHFLNHGWAVEPLKETDRLIEWAGTALDHVLHHNWRVQDNQRRDDIKELRRQLKRAREVSASRLKRLQKEPKQPVEPFRPRLVAAE